MGSETSSHPPVLIVVAGLPASGKTTLAGRLASLLGLPLMSKDTIKEALCETLGCPDIATSQRLGYASIVLLYRFAAAQLAAGGSCIIESLFHPTLAAQDLRLLKQRHPFAPLQILCYADGELLLERFVQRAGSGERHAAHMDVERLAEMPGYRAELLRGRAEPLDIGGPVIEVDTSVPAAVCYEDLAATIRSYIERRQLS